MSFTPRQLDINTLNGAAVYWAKEFERPSIKSHVPGSDRFITGKSYVMQSLYSATFKDEHEWLVKRIREAIDPAILAKFDHDCANVFEPRRDEVLEQLLLEKLAINPAGEHFPGSIGTTEIGTRVVGRRLKEVPKYAPRRYRDYWTLKKHGPLIEMRYLPKKMYWPVYAGEIEERLVESGVADKLPEDAWPWEPAPNVLAATNPRISNATAIGACDFIVDALDDGDAAANIRGRSGAQPAGVDEAESGTLLFTLVMNDPAFGAAADGTPGGIATAGAIADDASADATNTLGYCRCAAMGAGADDHIDGEAGTAGADFIFNTLAIVSGAVISMASFTVTMPES